MTQVIIETNLGKITVESNEDAAPETCANFLQYVDDAFYNETLFHRVIPSFMIQGGGHNSDMSPKHATRPAIKNEAKNGLKNTTGSIAMARTMGPHTATSQFFINVNDNASLDHTAEDIHGWGYCVFGEVIEGMDVVNTIKDVETGRNGPHKDVPVEPVIIESITRV